MSTNYVLASLMDAKRRFSIDNDRVYLSAIILGGDGAWDIATAHPDLWAVASLFVESHQVCDSVLTEHSLRSALFFTVSWLQKAPKFIEK